MECNKDDAVKAKAVAERKFTERDYAGAKRFALKAQNLYPTLEGMPEMLSTIDVYIAAENKICGESDWYGVLGVNPSDDDELVRKQYRKLALMLHPDKNKSVGAAGAFKLVLEAWNLLSDKSKRSTYSQKRNSRILTDSQTNGFYSKHVASNARQQNHNSRGNSNSNPAPDPSNTQQKNTTFWTICNQCKTHYEYLRMYLNHTLLCPNCHEAFLAVENSPPPHVFKPEKAVPAQTDKRSRGGNNTQMNNNNASRQSFNYVAPPPSVPQVVHQNSSKKRRMEDFFAPSRVVVGERNHVKVETAQNYYSNGRQQSRRELVLDPRSLLLLRAKSEIKKRLVDVKLISAGHAVADEKENHAQDAITFTPIVVPDPDFYNFDVDRSETSFEVDQVWAAYADGDGMPRFYARIQKVQSFQPFKVQISWLNSRSTSEFGSLNWIGSGFTKTCGDFRAGRIELSTTLNSFSHKVSWTKGPRGVIQLYPKKGEVWALYKNWSLDWNETTPKELVHQYNMVEVLEDYKKETGVSVAPLVKVAGFKTVFQRHMDPNKVQRIQMEEMFRFSHQVPSHLLTGQEAPNAPKGCLELDPGAMPMDLLQVTTGAQDDGILYI